MDTRDQREARVESTDGRRLTGYAIVFDSMSEDLGGFREIIHPDAVNRALNSGADIRALADHDSGKVIGRTRSGTLQLRKDSRGLHVVIEPDPEITYARDLLRSVARGDISGMSFGFNVPKGGDDWNFDGKTPIRTVMDMNIKEVSVVAFPAYTSTDVHARARTDEAIRSLREFTKQNPTRDAKWIETRLRLAR